MYGKFIAKSGRERILTRSPAVARKADCTKYHIYIYI